jgi:hypothetical protein
VQLAGSYNPLHAPVVVVVNVVDVVQLPAIAMLPISTLNPVARKKSWTVGVCKVAIRDVYWEQLAKPTMPTSITTDPLCMLLMRKLSRPSSKSTAPPIIDAKSSKNCTSTSF